MNDIKKLLLVSLICKWGFYKLGEGRMSRWQKGLAEGYFRDKIAQVVTCKARHNIISHNRLLCC